MTACSKLKDSSNRLGSSEKWHGIFPSNGLLIFGRLGTGFSGKLSLDLGNGEHEGIPVSLIEAMAHGLPVISTQTGGIPELVTGGDEWRR